MSEEELFESLRPIRVPAEFARFDLLDVLVLFGFGALLAWGCAVLISRFFIKEPSEDEKLARDFAQLQNRPREEQILGVSRIWKRYGKAQPLPENLHAALYDPKVEFDLERYQSWLDEVRQ